MRYLILITLLLGAGLAAFLLLAGESEQVTVFGVDVRAEASQAPEVVPAETAPLVDAIPAVPFDGSDDVAPQDPAEPVLNGTFVRGRLVDADDKPLADETITIRSRREHRGSVSHDQKTATTNAKGEFECRGIAVGAVVQVSSSPKAALDVSAEERCVSEKGLDVGTLKALRGESLAGTLRTASGQGLAGVKVVASRQEPGAPHSISFGEFGMNAGGGAKRAAMTNADGAFKIQGLARGPIHLTARPAGSLAEARGTAQVGSSEPVVLILPAGAELRGIVVDSAGKPVADAQVAVSIGKPSNNDLPEGIFSGNNWSSSTTGRTTTDKDGRFTLQALAQDMKPRARVTKAGYVTAEQDLEGMDVTIRLQRTGVVCGVITSAAGLPLDGVKVMHRQTQWNGFSQSAPRVVYGKEAASASGIAETPGLYALLDTQPGQFTLNVSAADHVALNCENLSLQADEVVRHDVQLDRAVFLEGVVLDPAGQPVAGAEVSADGSTESDFSGMGAMQIFGPHAAKPAERTVPATPWHQVTSGADGHFRFVGLHPAKYKLQASHDAFATSALSEVLLEKSVQPPEQRLQLVAGGAIEGTATDADGNGKVFRTITVEATQRDAEPRATGMRFMQAGLRTGHRECITDEQGRFRMSGVAPGQWDVTVAENASQNRVRFAFMGSSMGGRNEDAVTCEVSAGATTKVELKEKALGSVEVVVRSAGLPVPEAKVELRVQSKAESGLGEMNFMGFSGFEAPTRTDAEGRYRFERKKPGDYEVVAWGPGGTESVSAKVEVTERGTARATLELPGACIEGRVLGKDTGLGIAGVNVRAERKAEKSEPSETTASSMSVFSVATSGEDGGAMVFTSGGPDAVRTDADGRYALRFLKPGNYTLRFEGAGIIDGSLKDIEIAPEALRSGTDYRANQGCTLVVKVTNFADLGADWVRVSLSCTPGEQREEFIHNNGSTKVRGLKPGTYTILLYTEDRKHRATRDATLSPGAETTIEVSL